MGTEHALQFAVCLQLCGVFQCNFSLPPQTVQMVTQQAASLDIGVIYYLFLGKGRKMCFFIVCLGCFTVRLMEVLLVV